MSNSVIVGFQNFRSVIHRLLTLYLYVKHVVKSPVAAHVQSSKHNSHYTLIHSGEATLIHGDIHNYLPVFDEHIDSRTYNFVSDW